MTPERIVELARECLDTPFRHQGRIPRVGIDCAGVVIFVFNAIRAASGTPPYQMADYGRSPYPRRMIAELEQNLSRIQVREWSVGDVLHMAWRKYPQHLAIVTDKGILHACAEFGRCVEHSLDDYWRARVRAAYRFPGGASWQS